MDDETIAFILLSAAGFVIAFLAWVLGHIIYGRNKR